MENMLPVANLGDENPNVVENNSGGNGNNVAQSQAPVNVGSQGGVSSEGYIPTMRVPTVPSGSAEKPDKFSGSYFKR